MQQNNSRVQKPPVMLRAWGDEPVRLFLHRIANKRCYVGQEASTTAIGIPNEQVFWFDVDRFAQLRAAFQQNDLCKLGELWANIPVDDYACNKYQDVIESLHDQEDIANSECATSRNTE
jgi:hypothetical protein